MPRPSCSWMISPVPTDRAGLVGPALLNRLGNCKYRTVSRAAGAGPSPPASRPEPPSPTSTPPPACGRATTQPATRWWQRPSGLAQPGPGTEAGRCPHRRCPGAGPGGPAPAPAGPRGTDGISGNRPAPRRPGPEHHRGLGRRQGGDEELVAQRQALLIHRLEGLHQLVP